MTNDKFGNTLNPGNVVVFTSTPHRGHRPNIRVGKIVSISPKGKITIQMAQASDLVNNHPAAWMECTGSKITLNSARNVIRW